MKRFWINLLILLFFAGITCKLAADEFNIRVTREDFSEFYGVLIIEDTIKALPLSDILFSGFDPVTGRLKQDELFSIKAMKKDSPQKEDVFTRKKEKTPETIQNINLSEQQTPKNTFNERIIAVNSLIKTQEKRSKIRELLAELEEDAGNNPVNLSNLGKLYLKIGDTQKALELLQASTELSPGDYRLLYAYAIAMYTSSQLNPAEDALLKVARMKPDFMYAHYNLGNLYYRKQEYKKALDNFKKAMELAPDNSDIYFNIGASLEMLGYDQLAGRFYAKCLELNPDDSEASKALQRLD